MSSLLGGGSGGSSSLTVGTTPISGGTDKAILYQGTGANSGKLEEDDRWTFDPDQQGHVVLGTNNPVATFPGIDGNPSGEMSLMILGGSSASYQFQIALVSQWWEGTNIGMKSEPAQPSWWNIWTATPTATGMGVPPEWNGLYLMGINYVGTGTNFNPIVFDEVGTTYFNNAILFFNKNNANPNVWEFKVKIAALTPAAGVGNFWTLTLPDNPGNPDYVFTTDGAGNVTWTLPKLFVGSTTITSGAANAILFDSGPGTLGEDANFVWDQSNGRLGVGTSAPGYPTEIVSAQNNTLKLTGSNTIGVSFLLDALGGGGLNYQFFASGSANTLGVGFGVYEQSTDTLPLFVDIAPDGGGGQNHFVTTSANGGFYWTDVAKYAEATSTGHTDTGMSRIAAKTVGFGNGTFQNVSGTASLTTVILNTNNTLPGAPTAGELAAVSNAVAPVVGAALVQGGAAFAAVCWNGAQWTVFSV